MNFDAVILAGGKSQRMDGDKSWLRVDGQPLIVRQVEIAKAVGAGRVFISGRRGVDYAAAKAPVVLDEYVGCGPLAGIERGLAAASAPLLLVLAVDLPRVSEQLLNEVLEQCTDTCGALPCIHGKIEPVLAVYPKACHPIAKRFLQRNECGAGHFAMACVHCGEMEIIRLAPEDAPLFANCNSPADLAKL